MLDIFLHAFTSYLVLIDPLGAALVFHALTRSAEPLWIRRAAWRATLISLAITLLAGLFGEALLRRLGISLEALWVSGGLLLFVTAYHMVLSADPPRRRMLQQNDIAVFPMAIPLISGPGCLTLTILLFSRSPSPTATLPLVAAIVLSHLLTLGTLLAAPSLRRIIGDAGSDIVRRLLGVILAALSVQFVVDGLLRIIPR